LQRLIGRSQWEAIQNASQGEEGDYFKSLLTDLSRTIDTMPATYQTDGQGDEAIATLHYFQAGSDWWIIERDTNEDQSQAFGFVYLNGDVINAEYGYISIAELIHHGVELDLYFPPTPMRQIKERLEIDDPGKAATCTGTSIPHQV